MKPFQMSRKFPNYFKLDLHLGTYYIVSRHLHIERSKGHLWPRFKKSFSAKLKDSVRGLRGRLGYRSIDVQFNYLSYEVLQYDVSTYGSKDI